MKDRKLSRRAVAKVIGGGLIAAPILAAAVQHVRTSRAEIVIDTTALLAPLHVGDRLARWTVEAASMDHGALVVAMLGDDGTRFRLEVLARDPSPVAAKPPGTTERLAIFVRNGGDGATPTNEEAGIAAMALADLMRGNEAMVALDGLPTHAERLAAHRAALMSEPS
jgi:hypothetical protein